MKLGYACVAMIVVVALNFTGCGSKTGALPVTGAVTFQGQPVAEGEIVFTPVNTTTNSVAGKIEQGRYMCELPAGRSLVRITAYRPTGKMDRSNPGQESPVVEMYIPDKFNAKSTLEVNVEQANQQLDFPLVSP